MRALHARFAPLALTAALAACGDSDDPSQPTDTDTTDTGDTGVDDVGADAGADADNDTLPGLDTGPDADGGPDVTPDGGPDADTTEDTDTAPATYSVGGTVEPDGFVRDLAETGGVWLTLSVDDAVVEELNVTSFGDYAFAATLSDGAAYAVTVTGLPYLTFCAVDAGAGTIDGADASVAVGCERGAEFDTYQLTRRRSLYGTAKEAIFGEDSVEIRAISFSDADLDAEPFAPDPENASGRIERYSLDSTWLGEIQSEGFGPDGVFGTDDDFDEVVSYREVTLDDDGRPVREAEYEGSGDDGEWFTDDDEVDEEAGYRYTLDGDGRVTCKEWLSPGPDLVTGTEDDVTTYAEVYVYETATGFDLPGTRTYQIDDVGDDGLHCTDDDDTSLRTFAYASDDGRSRIWPAGDSHYTLAELDASGTSVRQTRYEMAAPPTIGGPDVDTIVDMYLFDDRHPFDDGLRRFESQGPGPDGVWGNDDDLFAESDDVAVRNDDGDIVRIFSYDDDDDESRSGPDQMWGTNDDIARWVDTTSGDDTVSCTTRQTSSGDDDLWAEPNCGNDAGDDTVAFVQWSELDGEGRPVLSCVSVDAGDDGIWRTDDDEIGNPGGLGLETACSRNVYQGDDVVVSLTLFPGPDDTWLTDDDTVIEVSVQRHDEAGRVVLDADYDTDDGDPETLAGADGLWLTDDDLPFLYYTVTFDRGGNLVRTVFYNRAGDDGNWFTDDDTISSEDRWIIVPDLPFLVPR